MKTNSTFKVRGLQIITLTLFSLLLLFSCKGVESSQDMLPRSTPEDEGVSSDAILSFLNAVEQSGIELHSFMFLRHGKVIAEGWWDPYKPELKHTLYSTSKSFTSTAIGIAVSENLIATDDKVISFFPDELPDTISGNLEAMTIWDLLTMSAGQNPEPTFSLLQSDNWIKTFFEAPVPDKPGTRFLYNSAATYMLSAIITKVTGETVLEYLTPRLFEPLNITGMDWETDPNGISTGGWGLRLKTEDMAKFGQLYLQKGNWNGKQIIPEVWIEAATSKQIDQAPDLSEAEKSSNDWQQGYGYKFWRSRYNSYRADGAYGQCILIFPEQDAVIAITAESHDMQREFSLVWDYLRPAMGNEPLKADDESLEQLTAALNSLTLTPPKANENHSMEQEIQNKQFVFDMDGKELPVKFRFEENRAVVTFFSEDDEETIAFGSEEWVVGETDIPGTNLLPQPPERDSELFPMKVAGAWSWKDPNTLELVLRYIESPHTEFFTFLFNEDQITLQRTDSRTKRSKVKSYDGRVGE